jgi:hypothetical protein
MGLWLLIPEFQRLGTWDLIRGTFGDDTLNSRLALQMVNEAALCVNRLRKRGSLCNQGFSLVNGLSFLATDESIHELLDQQSIEQYENLQLNLLKIRNLSGHYHPEQKILAIDPHRIASTTQRLMPMKKKKPEEPSKKMLQTFFCNDVSTRQPLAFTVASTGKTCSKATLQLVQIVEEAGITDALVLADKEHFTEEIASHFHRHQSFSILVPAPNIKSVTRNFSNIEYSTLWAGFAIGETPFRFKSSELPYRLIVQRFGEIPEKYSYSAFLTDSNKNAEELMCDFDKRWSIEEFFNIEGNMGWNRASTFNLNIRYGKQTLALMAQAAMYQLKKKLPEPFSQWSAPELSENILTNMEGDIRVKDDTIIITYYKDHEKLNLRNHYQEISQQLIQEGINPKIPWLYDFKLEFRFK